MNDRTDSAFFANAMNVAVDALIRNNPPRADGVDENVIDAIAAIREAVKYLLTGA